MNIDFRTKINIFKPRKEKIKNFEHPAPPYYEYNFVNINDKDIKAKKNLSMKK